MGKFVTVGRYVINTEHISYINTQMTGNPAERGKQITVIFDDGLTIDLAGDEAQVLLARVDPDWARAAALPSPPARS